MRNESDPIYLKDPHGNLLMLHNPTDEKIARAGKAFGLMRISAEEYRETEDERMGRDGSVPTGGYEELDVGDG